MLMKRMKPHIFLSFSMFFFGLLMTLQGFVQNYGGLITTRFLLGIGEAGIYPGCYYLISMWYKRREAQTRFTFFFAGASFAGAFGGLLASAIGLMDGVGGYSAWRWIFILEGLLTCVLSFVFFFTISDFPERAKWLSEAEKKIILARLASDQGDSGMQHKFQLRDVLLVVRDWKIFLSAPLYFSIVVSAYGKPSLIRDPPKSDTHHFRPCVLYTVHRRLVRLHWHPSPAPFRHSLVCDPRIRSRHGLRFRPHQSPFSFHGHLSRVRHRGKHHATHHPRQPASRIRRRVFVSHGHIRHCPHHRLLALNESAGPP